MDCNSFKNWLISRDGCDAASAQQARRHREECPDCDRLFSADEGLEQSLAAGIRQTTAPAGIARRARALAGQAPKATGTRRTPWFRWGLAPVLALAVTVVFVVWNPFVNPLSSLDAIGNYVLANHTRTDMAMAFKAEEANDPVDWFFQRLNYRITIPSMGRYGYTLVGGRECTIGPKKAAYLLYDGHGKRASVFIVKAGDIKMTLQQDRRYRIDAPGHQIELWQNQDMVCILVQDRPAATPSTI